MFYKVETTKSFEKLSNDLEAEVPNHKFGVLHIHNLGETLRSKGIDFKEQSKVFEVCNPMYANQIIAQDMTLNTVLPCRISIYTENGTTTIAILKPTEMFKTMTDNTTVLELAKEIDEVMIKIVDSVK